MNAIHSCFDILPLLSASMTSSNCLTFSIAMTFLSGCLGTSFCAKATPRIVTRSTPMYRFLRRIGAPCLNLVAIRAWKEGATPARLLDGTDRIYLLPASVLVGQNVCAQRCCQQRRHY